MKSSLSTTRPMTLQHVVRLVRVLRHDPVQLLGHPLRVVTGLRPLGGSSMLFWGRKLKQPPDILEANLLRLDREMGNAAAAGVAVCATEVLVRYVLAGYRP